MSLLVTISRSGLTYFLEAQHPRRPTAYSHMGVHIFLFQYVYHCFRSLPSKNRFIYSRGAPNLLHLTGQKKKVRYREIVRRDTISRYQSRQIGIWIRYLDISYLVISHDMGYDVTNIAIYHAISHRITSKHQANTNSTKPTTSSRSTIFFFLLCFCPDLGLSSAWPFLSSFCCPSAGHIIRLTITPANSNLVPSGPGLLPERMFVSISFFFLLLFLSFFFLDTWCLVLLSSRGVPDT